MKRIEPIIDESRAVFRRILESVLEDGGLSMDRYQRYLSMQYHLTKGVQRHFLACASHPDLARRKSLRSFLVRFANEEELHFELALMDLGSLELGLLDCCLDVKLWWSYFDSIVMENPFIRLGATCILENISFTSGSVIDALFKRSSFLNSKNSRFVIIHRHDENYPHGAQILEALAGAELTENHLSDLRQGAITGAALYLRAFRWSMTGETVC